MLAELQRLESIERPKASAAIAEARDKGDLSENSEYDAAKEHTYKEEQQQGGHTEACTGLAHCNAHKEQYGADKEDVS